MLHCTRSPSWWISALLGLSTACSADSDPDWGDAQVTSSSDSNPDSRDAAVPSLADDTGSKGASSADPADDTTVDDSLAPAPVGSNTPSTSTDAGASSETTSVNPTQEPITDTPTQTPPSAVCTGTLPASFTNLCSGCHNTSGVPNDRYPDLYAYSQTESAFMERVRGGGDGMLAYSATSIADEDLKAIYAYFTSGESRPHAQTNDFGDLAPLFELGDAKNPPMTFTRDDGVLITRGGGRVRQRHELEGTFNPYGAHYFEDRSFGILVEDHTPNGESLIRVSYLPVGQPTPGTNFRAWKIYGEGNVFHANMGMNPASLPSLVYGDVDLSVNYATEVAPYMAVQVQQVTSNWRTSAPIEPGDVFEFEFGVFLEPGDVREGSRTSYYSDTYRYRVGQGGFTPDNADPAGELGPSRRAQQGGDGTNVWLYEDQEFAFEQMALNIQHENVQPFLRGRRLFHTDFETGAHSESGNPTFEDQAGKAGPLFVTKSCEACHLHNGPGKLLTSFDDTASTAVKLSAAGPLGSQLQLQEGSVSLVGTETRSVELADGTQVVLSKPQYDVVDTDGQKLRYSMRLARKLVGLGLLEAIDEATLLTRSDPADCDGDGISGRPALVVNPETGALALGRFGWKAEKVSVQHQVMDALEGDLGVGTHLIPDSAGNVELETPDLDDLTAYMQLLSVPAQRAADTSDVTAGEVLFRSIGCANCHVTDVVTGASHPLAELRGQSIKPYTDLLLHDMGEELADQSDIPSGTDIDPPGAREWRTPPLWGLGLHGIVNGNTGLLHDGRAASVTEAVLWHGGEAQLARDNFAQLSTADRSALLAFLESL